jgi:hypothetical protein
MNDLDQKLGTMIKTALAKPVYFRVSQGGDGKLAVEQVQFLRTEDLAALTNLEPRTIRGWVAKGMVPYYKAPGSSIVLFDAGEVIAAIKQSGLTDEGDGS